MDEWVERYGRSHRDPVNRFCHTLGIPMITISLPWFGVAAITGDGWIWAVSLFLGGWALQFIGHAFEGKPPEFLRDWRFLLVGLRWWFAKIRGKA